MNELWKVLRDPRVSTTIALGATVVAGLALILQGWRGAAATLFVAFQLPFLVSGAIAGIAVMGAGLALLIVHLDRTEAAQERRDIAAVQRDVLRLLTAATQRARSGR